MKILAAETATGWDQIVHWCINTGLNSGPKIIISILVLWGGFKLIKFIRKTMMKAFERRNVDASLRPFITSMVSIILKILLIISLIGYLGIPMSSFVALLGAGGLAVGMALSGTIQNVAGGVVILILRPFKVGDYISAQGFEGKVNSIKIFNTVLTTVDNKVITLPNGTLSSGSVINYSAMEQRRITVICKMARGVDVSKIQNDFFTMINQNDKILKEPKSEIVVVLNPDSVSLETRVWAQTKDYWEVNDTLNKQIYEYTVRENISTPYQKIDIIK
jgi:small conductance mechanosensitive channel